MMKVAQIHIHTHTQKGMRHVAKCIPLYAFVCGYGLHEWMIYCIAENSLDELVFLIKAKQVR